MLDDFRPIALSVVQDEYDHYLIGNHKRDAESSLDAVSRTQERLMGSWNELARDNKPESLIANWKDAAKSSFKTVSKADKTKKPAPMTTEEINKKSTLLSRVLDHNVNRVSSVFLTSSKAQTYLEDLFY